jgi:pimeloyl-ACP methyl ester carboxylesterase
MTYETRLIRINGLHMNVLVAGSGPDVLLVHGFPDDHKVWRKQIPTLVEAGYRVIAPDTRGCGESEMAGAVADYRIENLVADLVALLDTLTIRKVRLIAHDWGAVIAWRLAIAHPERVDRLIALSVGHPAAYARGGIGQKLKGYYILLLLMRGIAERLCVCCNWLLFRTMTRYPEEFPIWRRNLSRPGRLTAGMNYYRANWRMIFDAEHPAARVPVCGLWSSRDLFLAESQMKASQAHVGGTWRYVRVDGANHWLQLTAPHELNRLLLDYCR